MSSKARKHLATVRPDLVKYESDNVQARLTISICDDTGKPQAKDRFFVVTAKVGRQVVMGKYSDGKPILQDRANPHPDFEAWNFETDEKGYVHPLGRQSVRVLIENPDIEDAYKVGCRCQKAPNQPAAPGKKPSCQTWDGETATYWDGQSFAQKPCLGAVCPLRKEPPPKGDKRQPVPAKTQFKIVARLDEENFPQLLISECTGSDVNLANFASLIEQVQIKWAAMCKTAGFDVPLSWYNIPVRMTIYPHSGDNTRSPRIDYTLDCDIREVFTRRVEWQKQMSGYGGMFLSGRSRPLELSAGQLITEEIDDLDATEVLHLDHVDAPQPTTPAPSRLSPVSATSTPAPTQAEATPPASVRIDFTTGKDLKRQIVAAMEAEDINTISALLEVTAAKQEAKPESRNGMAKIWAEFAPAIHEAHPGLSELLTSIGCPAPEPKQEEPTDATPPAEEHPFSEPTAPVQAPAATTPPQVATQAPATPKRTQLEAVEDYGRQLMASEDKDAAYFFRKLLAEFSNNLDGDARMRWETIRRQKLGK